MPARLASSPTLQDPQMDPLTLAIAPPADESPEQKTRREAEEQEARRVSEAIDEALKQERLVSLDVKYGGWY